MANNSPGLFSRGSVCVQILLVTLKLIGFIVPLLLFVSAISCFTLTNFQVYVKGEFVGGCDILVQMHKDGEISDFFEAKGISSKFGEAAKGKAKE